MTQNSTLEPPALRSFDRIRPDRPAMAHAQSRQVLRALSRLQVHDTDS
jgi:hypothetical protein